MIHTLLHNMEGLTPPSSLWEAQRLQDNLLRRVQRIRRRSQMRGRSSSTRRQQQQQQQQQSIGLLAPLWYSYDHSSSSGSSSGSGSGSSSSSSRLLETNNNNEQQQQQQQPTTSIISPIQFGADPTGKRDSTAAFQKAMQTMLSICDDRNFFNNNNNNNNNMADNIKNCGSVTLDLQGGEYIISESLVVPMYYGNLHMERGMLRASPTLFPPDKWMIQVGGGGGGVESCQRNNTNDPQQCCNEFITIQDLFLDASHRAAGGIRIMSTMGAVISSCFLTGFRSVGIQVDKGHEVMITNCWLAEYYWSDARLPDAHSIGIQINGPDHVLSDVILFDYSHIGVEVGPDGGNLLEGVHIWNGSGTGFIVRGPTRLTECFVDYNKLVLVDPSYVVIQDTFFYHTYLSINVSETGSMDNVVMTGNQYGYPLPGRTIRVEGGELQTVTNVVIDNEIGGNVFTTIKTSLHRSDAKLFQFNLTDSLLVPTMIKHLLYSVVVVVGVAVVGAVGYDDNDAATESHVHHRALEPDNGIVTIEFERRVTATVMLEVSMSSDTITCLSDRTPQ